MVTLAPSTLDGLLALAARLPCRIIEGADGSIYLERYTLAELDGGGHLYLHRFRRGDEDRELHNHPWHGESRILWGSYREERLVDARPLISPAGEATITGRVIEHVYRPGSTSTLTPETYHRIDLITAEVWTLFVTGPAVQSWGFWSRTTGLVTPWRDFIRAKGQTPYEHPRSSER